MNLPTITFCARVGADSGPREPSPMPTRRPPLAGGKGKSAAVLVVAQGELGTG